jgi:HMG box factor
VGVLARLTHTTFITHIRFLPCSYPDYKYQPVYRRSNVVRRKMKPDPVEEKRCTVVASLLLEGKEGAELEAGAAKAVEASNKKRAKIQRALAAK